MSKAKRWFITPYLLGLVGVSVGAVWQGVIGHAGWWSLELLTVPVAVITAVHALFPSRARTPRRYPSFVVAGVLGWGGTLVGWPDVVPVIVGGVLMATLIAYLYWYSEFGVAPSRFLSVGQKLPAFEALHHDQAVLSSDLHGKPALILFYRGNWCPVCTAQIHELARDYQALEARGIRVVLVSPQPDAHSTQLAQKVGLPFEFWQDQDNRAARALGIVDPAGLPLGMEALGYGAETPIPTALLVDAQGVILYSDQAENYRIRPEPREYLDAFDRAVMPQHREA